MDTIAIVHRNYSALQSIIDQFVEISSISYVFAKAFFCSEDYAERLSIAKRPLLQSNCRLGEEAHSVRTIAVAF